MARRRDSKGRGPERSPERNRLALIGLRVGVWSLVGIGAILLGTGLFLGLNKVFFATNEHFILRRIEVDVRSGAVGAERVRTMIAETGVIRDQTNLHAIDPAALRLALEADVLLRRAEVRLRNPDTLEVVVYGRTPLAQLLQIGGNLVDEEGVVIPPVANPQTRSLPVLTAIPGAAGLSVGDRMDDALIQAALRFLKLKATMANGAWLNPGIVQLSPGTDQLRVYLRGNPQLLLREDAVLILPGDDVEAAMKRAIAVIAERAAANVPTGEINATYMHVPATP